MILQNSKNYLKLNNFLALSTVPESNFLNKAYAAIGTTHPQLSHKSGEFPITQNFCVPSG